MAKTLQQIEEQIDALTREAQALRKAEMPGVIARIKEAIRHYDITARDLGLSGSARSVAPKPGGAGRSSGAAKYKDPKSSRTWTGKGRRPQWFVDALAEGKSSEELLV